MDWPGGICFRGSALEKGALCVATIKIDPPAGRFSGVKRGTV